MHGQNLRVVDKPIRAKIHVFTWPRLRLARTSCRLRPPCFRVKRSIGRQRRYMPRGITKVFLTSAKFEYYNRAANIINFTAYSSYRLGLDFRRHTA